MRGIVVSYGETPNTRKAFALLKEGEAEKFSYVLIGKRLGMITEIMRQNEIYGMLPSLAKVDAEELAKHLNADEWHQTLVEISLLGEVGEEGFRKRVSPPFPGEEVVSAPPETVEEALAKERDLFLGRGVGGFKVAVPLESLKKHVAVLAMSGAGKSNLVKHLILELMKKERRPGIVVLDMHGEYRQLAEMGELEGKVEVIPLEDVKVAFTSLTAGIVGRVVEDISERRSGLLKGLLEEAKKKGITTLEGFAEAFREGTIGKKVKGNQRSALEGDLEILSSLNVVGESDYPNFESDVRLEEKMVIFDASAVGGKDELRFKAFLVLNRLFQLRKRWVLEGRGGIPPTVVFVEEAHNLFTDSGAVKKEGEKIAREGRKFSLSLVLITQRPAFISQTVLSQCNTQILMRIMNPYDQERVKSSVEGASQEVLSALPTLETGEGIAVGEGLNFPVVFRAPLVRGKKERSYREELEEYWEEWERKKKREADAEDLADAL